MRVCLSNRRWHWQRRMTALISDARINPHSILIKWCMTICPLMVKYDDTRILESSLTLLERITFIGFLRLFWFQLNANLLIFSLYVLKCVFISFEVALFKNCSSGRLINLTLYMHIFFHLYRKWCMRYLSLYVYSCTMFVYVYVISKIVTCTFVYLWILNLLSNEFLHWSVNSVKACKWICSM